MTQPLLTTVTSVFVFAGLGLLFFALALLAMVRLSPFSVRKEIEQDQNVALAILMASIVLGTAIVVAAVVRG